MPGGVRALRRATGPSRELTRPVAAQVADLALAAGFIVNPVTPSALRLAPPLILTWEQAAAYALEP